MTEIGPKDFYDDVDNEHQISRVLKRRRYIKPFKFMYIRFFVKGIVWMTASVMQEKLCIPDRQEAHQILSSLCILNLLQKQKKVGNTTLYYVPINKHWWDKFGRKEKNGSRKSD